MTEPKKPRGQPRQYEEGKLAYLFVKLSKEDKAAIAHAQAIEGEKTLSRFVKGILLPACSKIIADNEKNK